MLATRNPAAQIVPFGRDHNSQARSGPVAVDNGGDALACDSWADHSA